MRPMNTAPTVAVVRGDTVQNEMLFTVLENGSPLHSNWRFLDAVRAYFSRLVSQVASPMVLFSVAGTPKAVGTRVVAPVSEWISGFERELVFVDGPAEMEDLAKALWKVPWVSENVFAAVRRATGMELKSPASYTLERVSDNASMSAEFLVYYGDTGETEGNYVGRLSAAETPKLGLVYTIATEGEPLMAMGGLVSKVDPYQKITVVPDPEGYLIRRALYQHELRLRLRPEDCIL